MKVKVLIVDDEPLARERLRQLLAGDERAEIVGECADGKSALNAIRDQAPDVVFMDVQMPELDGFEVVSRIDPGKMPRIVFVTAHDKFALKAFEIHAIDYLLKPFDRERFQVALQRAIEAVSNNAGGDMAEKIAALLAEAQPAPHPDRIAVKSTGRIVFVRAEEIDWIEAADNYANLHVGVDSHLLRETMSSLEKRLSPAKFIRISRSTIVQIDRIKELQPLFHGDYAVILRDGTKLTLTRNYRDQLEHLLGKNG